MGAAPLAEAGAAPLGGGTVPLGRMIGMALAAVTEQMPACSRFWSQAAELNSE